MNRLLPLLLLGGLLAAPAAAQVDLSSGPVRGQLYPRDLVTGQATATVAGNVTQGGWAAVRLEVTAGGRPHFDQSHPLQYVNGAAPFSFAPVIQAGLVEYQFKLFLQGGGLQQQVGFVGHVVCGDVYLIQGQSNAVAGDGHGEGLANAESQSRWTRSFGTGALAGTADKPYWYLADGETGTAEGSVGGWGIRLAQHIVERVGVPVAVLNGAVGATPIKWHQRDDLDHENLGTNYGRLLWRARTAGLDQHVRAVLWYQGEADGATPYSEYLYWFRELRDDWLEDFPATERIYVFQIHDGCGVNGMGIREIQRQFADRFPGLSVMSTAGSGGHDGCHYRYSGYRELGDRVARLVGRDLYGLPMPAAADAPNIRSARFTSAARDEIALDFRDPLEVLHLDPGIEAYLQVSGPEVVTQASAGPGTLLLQLSGPTAATRVSWIGHEKGGPWIRNRLGIGALTFDVPILP
ncbi:MAG: hypothetical protein H8E31_11710 [Planctomycetes bacterium]|nr:hypothetical protein [Planctomycetota bacterium]